MIKKIFKWIGLSICGLFVVLGFMGLFLGLEFKDYFIFFIIGILPPLFYYIFNTEGNFWDKFVTKVLTGKYGVIIGVVLIVLYFASRILRKFAE